MHTGPNLKVEKALTELRDTKFSGAIADGNLTSGQAYEIKLSAKSAVREGLHLLITFPGAVALNKVEEVECFAILNEFASQHPLAQEFGYRYAQNFGEMLSRPEPHAHAIIPGCEEEKEAGPRIITPWRP